MPEILSPPYIIAQDGKLTFEQRAILRNMKPMICTPMYGGQCFGQYTYGVAALMKKVGEIGMEVVPYFLYNESLIQRARNTLVSTFLKSDCTHLFFIDADIGFRPDDFLSVLLAAHFENQPLIGATYPRKQINWPAVRAAIAAGKPDSVLPHCAGYNVFVINKDTKIEVYPNQVFPCRYIGTGFMCIKRDTFDKLIVAYPDMWVNNNQYTGNTTLNEKIWTFFDCKPSADPERFYRSEDYYFSDICHDIGIKTTVCPWVLLDHNGFLAYHGCVFCSNGIYVHEFNETK